MKHVGHICFILLFASSVFGQATAPNLADDGIVSPANRGFFDTGIDYSKFSGRVTDKDETGRVFKIKSDFHNSKFFHNGDAVKFTVNETESRGHCTAYVRGTEDEYFIIYVDDFSPCWNTNNYFRRGMVLNFETELLAKRVYEASKHRETLLLQKDDFLKQLNGVNHFLWTYDQEKIKLTADFDQRITQLKQEKRKAVDGLIDKKQESLNLQLVLIKRMNTLDAKLDFYRVERQEIMLDRWNMDHDQGLPFGQRPVALKRP